MSVDVFIAFVVFDAVQCKQRYVMSRMFADRAGDFLFVSLLGSHFLVAVCQVWLAGDLLLVIHIQPLPKYFFELGYFVVLL